MKIIGKIIELLMILGAVIGGCIKDYAIASTFLLWAIYTHMLRRDDEK